MYSIHISLHWKSRSLTYRGLYSENIAVSSTGLVAQRITRLTTDQKIPGSNPGKLVHIFGLLFDLNKNTSTQRRYLHSHRIAFRRGIHITVQTPTCYPIQGGCFCFFDFITIHCQNSLHCESNHLVR